MNPSANEKKKKLVFFYQLRESWINVQSIWKAAQEDPDVNTEVVLIPFIHKDYDWSFQAAKSHLDSLGVHYVPWNEYDLRDTRSSAVIYTSPYDNTRPDQYHFQTVRQFAKIVAYAPYSLEVCGGTNINILHYGQPVATESDAIFARSESVRASFEEHCPTGSAHVFVTGHPRMDNFINLEDFEVDPSLTDQIGDRKAVLWNAQQSIDGDIWSTFDYFADYIFEKFFEEQEIALIFRPHPLLWQKLINLEILTKIDIENLKKELNDRGIIIDERADHRHAFSASTAMISDAGSFLMEYLVTEKPVLYLNNPYGLGLCDEGRYVVKYYDMANNIKDIDYFIKKIKYGQDENQSLRIDAIPKFFHLHDGKAGERALQILKGMIQ